MGQRPPLQANRPKLPILPGENHILIPWLPDIPNVLPVSHIHTSWHAGWCGARWTRLPGAVEPVCERHTHTLSPRRVSAVCVRHGSSSHVPRYIASRRRPVSVDWSAGYGIGLPSTSQRALLCSLLKRRDASKNPEQCSFSESQYSGSIQHGILGWPLILSLPGRHTSTRWERRRLKDWACLAPSLTGEAACPSETMCCSTSSSSVLWWITHVRSGGPQPRPEAASATIQVSSHCNFRTLVRW
jgi:hypothetical protein